MCPSRSAEALRGHINVPIAYKELINNRFSLDFELIAST